MQVIDATNKKIGKTSISLAAQDVNKKWKMKQEKKSKSFTTKWDEILIVK
jgi:DNA polymerase V